MLQFFLYLIAFLFLLFIFYVRRVLAPYSKRLAAIQNELDALDSAPRNDQNLKKIKSLYFEILQNPRCRTEVVLKVMRSLWKKDEDLALPFFKEYLEQQGAKLNTPVRVEYIRLIKEAKPEEALDEARLFLATLSEKYKPPAWYDSKEILEDTTFCLGIMMEKFLQLGMHSYTHRFIHIIEAMSAGEPVGTMDDLKSYIHLFYTFPQLDKAAFKKWREAIPEIEERNAARKDLNEKWESFFIRGYHLSELCDHCLAEGFPKMAQRLELIEGNLRFGVNGPFNPIEPFQLVWQEADSGAIYLS